MSVPMALVDFIPVVIFLLSSVSLQRDLYNKLSKGAFALFCAGTMMVVFAGGYKALWKALYCLGVCDFSALSQCFLPMQSTGFFLVAAALIAMFFFKQGNTRAYSVAAAPAVFKGTMFFIPMMVLGIGTIYAALGWFAAKLGKKWLIPLMVVGFLCLLGMGYLSTKDFSNPMMNWIAELVNTLGQALMYIGCRVLRKAGLADFEMPEPKRYRAENNS